MTHIPMLVGRNALVEGPAYDLQRVLDAHESLIEALSGAFGGGASIVTTDRTGMDRPYAWPQPGRAIARILWGRIKGAYDVVDEPLVHVIGPLTVKAYLLGKTWCVHHPGTGEILTAEGAHPSMLDPVPTVCVYGERIEGGCKLLEPAVLDRVEALLAGPLDGLALDLDRSRAPQAVAAGAAASDYGFITFPHGVYGAGRSLLTVRCVSADGGEIDEGDSGPLQ